MADRNLTRVFGSPTLLGNLTKFICPNLPYNINSNFCALQRFPLPSGALASTTAMAAKTTLIMNSRFQIMTFSRFLQFAVTNAKKAAS